jgi:hypothetical protein
MQGAPGLIEPPFAFTPAFQPAKPVEVALVDGLTTVSKGPAVVIQPVQLPGQTELPEVVCALDAASGGFASRQGGQQQAGQHRDDGDDDEEFNQRKRLE